MTPIPPSIFRPPTHSSTAHLQSSTRQKRNPVGLSDIGFYFPTENSRSERGTENTSPIINLIMWIYPVEIWSDNSILPSSSPAETRTPAARWMRCHEEKAEFRDESLAKAPPSSPREAGSGLTKRCLSCRLNGSGPVPHLVPEVGSRRSPSPAGFYRHRGAGGSAPLCLAKSCTMLYRCRSRSVSVTS